MEKIIVRSAFRGANYGVPSKRSETAEPKQNIQTIFKSAVTEQKLQANKIVF